MSAFSLDYLPPPTKDRCYVHCSFCGAIVMDLALQVSVPCSSDSKVVIVRCGHCTATNQLNFSQHDHCNPSETMTSTVRSDEAPKVPAINRPPEKRRRSSSAYNRFMKDEIQRIKAGNPDITHREAFSTAAKNWAPFSRNHFGHLLDQAVKKTSVRQQEGEDVLL